MPTASATGAAGGQDKQPALMELPMWLLVLGSKGEAAQASWSTGELRWVRGAERLWRAGVQGLVARVDPAHQGRHKLGYFISSGWIMSVQAAQLCGLGGEGRHNEKELLEKAQ